jgi:ADP-ribose pyrophosphatase
VPAGKLEAGESPVESARREVEEETGYRVGTLLALGSIWTTPGFTNEKIWLYAATDLEAGRQKLEDDEALMVESLPLRDAVAMALRGEICDSKSVVALLRAERLLAASAGRAADEVGP